MRPLSQKTVFAILMGAMFVFAIILAIELKLNFAWILGGYVIVFGAAFTFLYVRFAPVVIIGTIVLLLCGYLLIKFGSEGAGKSVSIGAIAAIATVLMLQMGWVKPHMENTTQSTDYAQQQQALYQQEKGGVQNYAQQQQALYEQEKARQAQGGQGQGPAA
jgi:hypothetical protein